MSGVADSAAVQDGGQVTCEMLPIDVLMTTYSRERPEFLQEALESLCAQTADFRTLVLVLDGPVTEPLEHVIHAFEIRLGPRLRVVRLPENVGPGRAANAGLLACDSPWIARMDSDDVSRPDRLAVQWAMLQRQPDVDVIFSWQGEFTTNWRNLVSVKGSPTDHDDIVQALRWRNLVAQPSIIMRRAALDKIGGYWDSRVLEDYDLYWRLISSGAKFACVPDTLVPIRVSEQRGRRGGWRYVVSDWRMRRDCWRRGDFSFAFFVISSLMYTAFRFVPARIMPILYKAVRRAP